MDSKILGCSIKDKVLSKTKFVNHVSRNVTGLIKNGAIMKPFEMTVDVIILPDGGQVVPYFKDFKGRWKIVLVSQYRAAIKKKTIEGAGGRLGRETALAAFSRELEEEAGIKVKPSLMRIVLHEYGNPSITSGAVSGGIVEINAGAVKNKKRAGKKSENEWTQVEIFDLVDILRKRENGKIMIDLLTSRLLDEVAKAVGLLVKKY